MPSRIQVHAFAHVASEAVGLSGRIYGAAVHLTFAADRPGFLGRSRGIKAGRQATAEGGDTPVGVNAGYRPGGQPEAAADHLALSRRDSSPRSTTRPGTVRLAAPSRPARSARSSRSPRRRLMAWRTP